MKKEAEHGPRLPVAPVALVTAKHDQVTMVHWDGQVQVRIAPCDVPAVSASAVGVSTVSHLRTVKSEKNTQMPEITAVLQGRERLS